ncbi:hypothetical protein D9615_008972 [Tricholomella constricta]|uniref:Fungal-type protein kinase domain-containing protein n=1 Tax=Tricholomella constricta TaxID=117010 RepID=A0A8H5LYV1_9AGAR|nr:hypothetical protein D9615_008972 [Tricholomella constricta]
MVKSDIDRSWDVSHTGPFIDSMFPVHHSDIDDIYDKLVRDRVYDEVNERWCCLPTDEKAEVKYNAAFVRVAEAIRKAYPSTKCDRLPYWSTWIDRHRLAPTPADKNASFDRPDVLNILGMDGNAVEWDSLMDSLDGESEAVAAWWLRVNAVVEIKPFEDEDILKRIYQLVSYLRETLREQLDRRFVPGLLLSRRQLAVWVADRSGVFGTHTTFDVHKEPKRFIQVILGCSILPPERLGWDITMRLCSNPSAPEPKYIHSFHKDVAFETYSSDTYTRHWVEMPPNEDQNKRELFMTSRVLSLSKAGCMQGRASVVRAAWKVERSEDARTTQGASREAEMYPDRKEAPENHIGRVYSSEDVHVEGVEISTESFVRCDLEHLSPPESLTLNCNGKREAEAGSFEPYLFITTDSDELIFESVTAKRPNWRVQTRTLLEDYRWPLHQFRDLSELVLVVLNAVQALKFLHLQAKTIQRDISIGNILICLDDTGHSRGCLIDLDHAMKTTDVKPTILTRARAATSLEDLKVARLILQIKTDQACTDDTALVLEFLKDWYFYYEAILKLNHQLAEKDLITPGDLGFLEEVRKPSHLSLAPADDTQVSEIPDYSTQSFSFSATLPFASPEVLTETRIFSHQKQSKIELRGGSIHDIIHDLEALFWCVTYICVTHEGPGGRRRTELQPDYMEEHPDANKDLRRINYYFFSSKNQTEFAHNKFMLFQYNEYESHVITQFHPYFEPLKGLMKQWWRILSTAHEFPIFEAAHDWLITALKDASEALKGQAPIITPEENREVDNFRKKDLRAS